MISKTYDTSRPHPHPKCGKQILHAAIFYGWIHVWLFSIIFVKHVRTVPCQGGGDTLNKNILLMFFHDFHKEHQKRDNNISAAGVFLKKKYTTSNVFLWIIMFLLSHKKIQKGSRRSTNQRILLPNSKFRDCSKYLKGISKYILFLYCLTGPFSKHA